MLQRGRRYRPSVSFIRPGCLTSEVYPCSGRVLIVRARTLEVSPAHRNVDSKLVRDLLIRDPFVESEHLNIVREFASTQILFISSRRLGFFAIYLASNCRDDHTLEDTHRIARVVVLFTGLPA